MPYLNPIPTLPDYSGPYRIGSSEFEIPISELDSRTSTLDPSITTIKFRIFYPTDSPQLFKKSIDWLPSPQRQWTEAYASFLGASSRWSNFISYLPSLVSYTKIPATQDAAIQASKTHVKYPLAIFSHGLGGNCNTYSAICGSLASYGIVCAAPEHRDGSAPVSFIHSADGETSAAIPYQKYSHTPVAEVLNARNAQLRTRLRELDLLYSALHKLNHGQILTNYATKHGKTTAPSFKGILNMDSGNVTWLGHSFGAASIVQLVKSVYYHQFCPSDKPSPEKSEWDWTPLYTPAENSKLASQITPSSPVALLDLWAMPLRGENTQWLWERPLPCYDRQRQAGHEQPVNTVAVMSTEFYNYPDTRKRTRALLSPDPVKAMEELSRQSSNDTQQTSAASPISPIPAAPESQVPSSLSRASSSSPSPPDSHKTSISSSTSLSTPPPTSSNNQPKLFTIPNSAHLSQSDFGLLFPNLARYFMKAQDPEETMELNIRAILAVIRGRGLEVAQREGQKEVEEDRILGGEGDVKRWIPVSLHD